MDQTSLGAHLDAKDTVFVVKPRARRARAARASLPHRSRPSRARGRTPRGLDRRGVRAHPPHALGYAAVASGRCACIGSKGCAFVPTAQAIRSSLRAAAQTATFFGFPAAIKR
jgi:hypothetical protein